MVKTINLEDILLCQIDQLRVLNPDESLYSNEKMKKSVEWSYFMDAMKEACKQVLELAAERAVLTHYIDGNISPRSKSIINLNNGAENTGESIGVNKQSILDTIKYIQ